MWVGVETWQEQNSYTPEKEEHKEKKLKLPPIIWLFHEYSIINDLRQFSKDKIQNTMMIPKQLRDKRLTNGQNKRQADTRDKVQILY